MPDNLVVPENQTVVLDDNPPAAFAGAWERYRITTLDDLVNIGIVRSRDNLATLLSAAQAATGAALRREGRITPAPGIDRVDLRRRDDFLSTAATVDAGEALAFWRVARGIDPYQIGGIEPGTAIGPAVRRHRQFIDVLEHDYLRYAFQNVEVQAGGTLEFARSVATFVCMDLVIRRNGRIVVKGDGLLISANSIQGEQ